MLKDMPTPSPGRCRFNATAIMLGVCVTLQVGISIWIAVHSDEPREGTHMNRRMNRRKKAANGMSTHHRVPNYWTVFDCSVWDTMCNSANLLENRYEEYPFPLSRQVKRPREVPLRPISTMPKSWKGALERPSNKKIEFRYPKKGSDLEIRTCIQTRSSLSWTEQIDNLLSSGQQQLKREPRTNMISFTIADINYARDMLHDVHQMTETIVGFGGSFFIVAIDQETVELACTYLYPVVAWSSAKGDAQSTALKHDVANTKFEVSLYLTSLNIDFFFYEMDVWFLQSPIDTIVEFHSNRTNDILISSHQSSPMTINIGVYSVLANERTKEFFELCILMASESPNTHDQWIFDQLLLLASNLRRGYELRGRFEHKWDPPPKTNPPKMKYPPNHGLYKSYEIVAGPRPLPTTSTLAIHTLCGKPLSTPWGKKMLAKELGSWYGFKSQGNEAAGYYVRSGRHRRYIMLDGFDSPNVYNTMQSYDFGLELDLFTDLTSFRWTIATILALARRTSRIFIMPSVLSISGAHYLWSVLDFQEVDRMGISYRETNFMHNRKSWLSEDIPISSAARTALAPIDEAGKESSMYAQFPSEGSSEIKAWEFQEGISDGEALDIFFAMHTAYPQIHDAELLLVNPHFSSAPYFSKFTASKTPQTVSQREIMDVLQRLKWCPPTNRKDTIVAREDTVGRSTADMACYGQGKTFK